MHWYWLFIYFFETFPIAPFFVQIRDFIGIILIQRCDEHKQFCVIYFCYTSVFVETMLMAHGRYSWEDWAEMERSEEKKEEGKQTLLLLKYERNSKNRNLCWSVEQINHFVNGKKDRCPMPSTFWVVITLCFYRGKSP